ncbi:RNA-binding protein hfq [Geminocystis sp.]|uniref:Hfq-related RNA-binding protein n=1 Tax=Geminocystis sp. TaxID=2664100 RepID=UPI0035942A55
MPVFNTGFPSIRQIQNFIKNQTSVEIGLMTSQTEEGIILWQDQNCFCVQNNQKEKILIWIQAVAYIKSK